MADTSQREGWWQASDGKWYPPEQSEGWWQASDGNWYPPETPPGPANARAMALCGQCGHEMDRRFRFCPSSGADQIPVPDEGEPADESADAPAGGPSPVEPAASPQTAVDAGGDEAGVEEGELPTLADRAAAAATAHQSRGPLILLVAAVVVAAGLAAVVAFALTGDGDGDQDPEPEAGAPTEADATETTDAAAPEPPPVAPSDFELRLVSGSCTPEGCEVEGSYTDNADNESRFVIVARTPSGGLLTTFDDPASDGVGGTNIDQEFSARNQTICVTVYAENGDGRRSDGSNEVCYTITADNEFVLE